MRDYTDGLLWNSYIWEPGYQPVIYLLPGGWLTAVMIKKLGPSWDELHFELTDDNLVPLFADFILPGHYDRFGKWFDPIPNMSSQCPYILRIPAYAPKLEILSVNRELDW